MFGAYGIKTESMYYVDTQAHRYTHVQGRTQTFFQEGVHTHTHTCTQPY